MNTGFSTHEWYYEQGKGKIRSYVARQKEPLTKVARTVSTLRRTGRVSAAQVERMFQEVLTESVQPFLGPPYHQPERQRRLDALKKALSSP